MAIEVVHPHKLQTHYFKSRLYMARANILTRPEFLKPSGSSWRVEGGHWISSILGHGSIIMHRLCDNTCVARWEKKKSLIQNPVTKQDT